MDRLVEIVKHGLSVREQEILEHLAKGQTAKQVAHGMLITPRMVERHIETMRVKMRARNTAHMITCGFLSGVLRIA